MGIVFGASSGIGAAVAARLGGVDAHVVAASRRGTTATATAGSMISATCDVRDPYSVQQTIDAAIDTGPVDWVVNAAGVGFYAPLNRGHEPQWRDILETNVLGALHILTALQSLDPPLGHLVHVGSLAAVRPSPTVGNQVYGVSKAAASTLIGRARADARSAGTMTKYTIVHPGFVGATEFTANYFRHHPDAEVPLLDRFEPLTPGDVADVVEYVLTQPENVEISEIVVRPRAQPD